jgi:hypothetical protein
MMFVSSCSSLATNIDRWHLSHHQRSANRETLKRYFLQDRRTENATISISVQMVYCCSVSPRSRAVVCEISKREVRRKFRQNLGVSQGHTASDALALPFTCGTGRTEYRKSVFFETCRNMTAQAVAAEHVSTRIRARHRVLRQLIHTYATLKHPLGSLSKLTSLRN